MLEGRLVKCIGPLTATEIKENPDFKNGVQITDEQIDEYMGARTGFLYEVRDVRKSAAKYGEWKGNGSNCQGLVDQVVGGEGQDKGKLRWTE
jgi:hypothetical protein